MQLKSNFCVNNLQNKNDHHAQRKNTDVTQHALFMEAIMDGDTYGSILRFIQLDIKILCFYCVPI